MQSQGTPILEKQDIKDGEIDTSLVDYHLTLSYEERIEAHEAARQLVSDLKNAGEEYYAKQFEVAP